MMLYILICLF